MEQQTGSKLGKEYIRAVYFHPTYLTYAEYIMHNVGLEEAQAGIKTAWEISITSDIQVTPPLWSKEELKIMLMKVKEKSEKAGLKLKI